MKDQLWNIEGFIIGEFCNIEGFIIGELCNIEDFIIGELCNIEDFIMTDLMNIPNQARDEGFDQTNINSSLILCFTYHTLSITIIISSCIYCNSVLHVLSYKYHKDPFFITLRTKPFFMHFTLKFIYQVYTSL